jgi:hypothetical protein
VQDDDPTMPQLPLISPSTPPGDGPSWPQGETQFPRALCGGIPAAALAIGLAISLVANGALLAALVSVLLFARAGFFAPSASSTSHTQAPSATTTSALASPTLSESWLQVAPSSVRLGCDGDQATQFIVLANTGTADVQWEAVFSVSADQAAVEVDPMQGDLSAGTSITVQIHNTSQAGAQQGVIRFAPDSSAAGAPPTLSYTTSSCS